MNAAAAHAAFVMTISAARKYWLLRHAQQASDINIHKLHPLPEKIGLGSADFLHSGTGCVAVFVLILIFLSISVKIFQNLKNSITISITIDFLHSGTPFLCS